MPKQKMILLSALSYLFSFANNFNIAKHWFLFYLYMHVPVDIYLAEIKNCLHIFFMSRCLVKEGYNFNSGQNPPAYDQWSCVSLSVYCEKNLSKDYLRFWKQELVETDLRNLGRLYIPKTMCNFVVEKKFQKTFFFFPYLNWYKHVPFVILNQFCEA